MGIAIKVAGASFTNSVGRVLPYAEDAFAHYLFGGTLADSLTNLVSTTDGTEVGSLTIGTNYITTNYNVGIDTGLTYSDDFAFCVVTERALGAGLGTTYHSGSTEDTFQIAGTGYTVRAFANGDVANFMDSAAMADTGKYHFFCLTKTGTAANLYHYDGSSLVAVPETVSAKTSAVPNVKIGGLSTLSPNGAYPAKLAMWAGYNVGLTAGQVEDVYEYMKDKCASRGLNVT